MSPRFCTVITMVDEPRSRIRDNGLFVIISSLEPLNAIIYKQYFLEIS